MRTQQLLGQVQKALGELRQKLSRMSAQSPRKWILDERLGLVAAPAGKLNIPFFCAFSRRKPRRAQPLSFWPAPPPGGFAG